MDVFEVTNDEPSGPGSLADALRQANETKGPTLIRFLGEHEPIQGQVVIPPNTILDGSAATWEAPD